VKRHLVLLLIAGAVLSMPQPLAAASRAPTIALSIIHVVRGCHVWARPSGAIGSDSTISVKPGTRVKIRLVCPMDFDVSQTRGPKLAIGGRRFYTGSTRVLVFRKAGVYRLRAKNVQTSEEVGLQTLGEDNVLRLTVRVK